MTRMNDETPPSESADASPEKDPASSETERAAALLKVRCPKCSGTDLFIVQVATDTHRALSGCRSCGHHFDRFQAWANQHPEEAKALTGFGPPAIINRLPTLAADLRLLLSSPDFTRHLNLSETVTLGDAANTLEAVEVRRGR